MAGRRCNAMITIGADEVYCEKTGHREQTPWTSGATHLGRLQGMDGFQPVSVIVTWPVQRRV